MNVQSLIRPVKKSIASVAVLVLTVFLSNTALADGGWFQKKITETVACPAGYSGTITYSCTYSSNVGEEGCRNKPYSQWKVEKNNCVLANTPPVAPDRVLTINEDSVGGLQLTAVDSDSAPPFAFSLSAAPSPAAGTASITGDYLTFQPAPNWYGQVQLQYTATDSNGATSAPATVTINVTPINDPPVIFNQILNINEDQPGSLTLFATDIENNVPFTYTALSVIPSNAGTVSMSGNTMTFYPSLNWNGQVNIQYQATDSSGAVSTPATITVNVAPVNDAPVITDRVLNINEDQPGSITLTATDVENNVPFTYTALSVTPSNAGTATVSGSTLTFNPALNWNGQVKIQYRATDSGGAVSTPATLTVNVAPVNDAPVLTGSSLTIRTNESRQTTVRAAVSR
ncbi:exported hypothetical protein [Pseudomonas veronii]|uniref:tandem-95 repeat protein n=1 Tax=Pseudomonas veronii TaxID=76761 RepID=UPI0017534AA5|nr:Ig-like domain-containing protein [Pseudomonas veronii]CAD0264182.1 exported hypothetical protein [Pseudomonas veronii]